MISIFICEVFALVYFRQIMSKIPNLLRRYECVHLTDKLKLFLHL